MLIFKEDKGVSVQEADQGDEDGSSGVSERHRKDQTLPYRLTKIWDVTERFAANLSQNP